jgi:hypothetical protein
MAMSKATSSPARQYKCQTSPQSRCRINKDTEEKSGEVTNEAHCLKTPDTVV